MSATPFLAFAELCEKLGSTNSRNEKVKQISNFILGLQTSEVAVAARFLTGRPVDEQGMGPIGIGGATLWRLTKTNSLQVSLLPNSTELSLLEVGKTFESLSSLRGADRQRRSENILDGLFSRFNELERKYALRLLSGEMEIGAIDGVILSAIAVSSKLSIEAVRRAYMTMGDIGHIAELALTNPEAVETARIVMFQPVRPMLADMATSIREVLEQHKHGTAFEYKYDGARVQIHKQGERVRVFSRRLSDVSMSIPEIVAVARECIRRQRVLLEAEVVAVGKNGKPLPFQDLMRRFGRVNDVARGTVEIPLQVHFFDILVLDDEELVERSYSERREFLEQEVPQEMLTPRLISRDEAEIQSFFNKAFAEGHEGLMAKSLESKYEVGKRGKKWLKLKRAETLDLAIVAADWGYGRRTGWLSNYHLAVRDENTGEFLEVGKTFKGLTDEEFEEMTDTLKELKSSETGFTVTVKPRIVVEVAYDEIQRSPQYKSGLALRFARIVRIRNDRSLDQVDSLKRLRSIFEQQFTRKGMLS